MFDRLSTHAHGPVTRPLVVRFGPMGDMVIALSLIHALHRRCGELVDVVSSGSWTRPLLESQPGVGNLYLIRSRKTPYAVSPQQQQLVRTLKARGTSPTWICDSDDKCRWLIARAGIPQSHIADVRSLPEQPREHAVDRWLRFAQASLALHDVSMRAIDARSLRVPPLRVAEQWRRELDMWLRASNLAGRPLVLVQAGILRIPRRRPVDGAGWPVEVVNTAVGTRPHASLRTPSTPTTLAASANRTPVNSRPMRQTRSRTLREDPR